MILKNSRARGRSYKHYLTKLAPKAFSAKDQEKVQAIVASWKAGSSAARDQLVEGHMRLAMQIAGRYYRHNGQEDIVSAALEGLVQAVDWFPKRGFDNNITPYIVTTIHRFISDFIQTDNIVHIPRKVYKDRKTNPEHVYIRNYENDCEFIPDGEDVADLADHVTIPTYDATPEIDIREEFDKCGLTDKERMLVRYVLEGFTQAEIGVKLGCTFQNVSKLFIRLREKLTNADFSSPIRKLNSIIKAG